MCVVCMCERGALGREEAGEKGREGQCWRPSAAGAGLKEDGAEWSGGPARVPRPPAPAAAEPSQADKRGRGRAQSRAGDANPSPRARLLNQGAAGLRSAWGGG